jgi:hypothetical protein
MIQTNSIVQFTNPLSRTRAIKRGTVLKIGRYTALVQFTHRRQTHEEYFQLRQLKLYKERNVTNTITRVPLTTTQQITPIIEHIFNEKPVISSRVQRIPTAQFPDAKIIIIRARVTCTAKMRINTARLKRELHKYFDNLSDIDGAVDDIDLRVTINDGPWHAKFANGCRLGNSIYFQNN